MDLKWDTIASCIAALAAVIALLISLRQGRMSNRQSLFDRRLKIWLTVDKLMELYRNNSMQLKQDDEPQLAVSLNFMWLTNTTFLQEITPSISHVHDSEYQLKLHLKLDEMKSLSTEAIYVFKGKPKELLADFLDVYRSLLLAMYQYQIALDEMESNSKKFGWTLEEAVVGVGEKRYRVALYDAENRLAAAYEQLDNKRVLGKIRRQIRLDSTLADYFNMFR